MTISEEDRAFAYAVINDDLPMCGCGTPEAALDLIRDTLLEVDKVDGVTWPAPLADDAVRYLVLGTLDRADLIDHGTGIDYSWLTEKGARFLRLLTVDDFDYDAIDEGGYGE